MAYKKPDISTVQKDDRPMPLILFDNGYPVLPCEPGSKAVTLPGWSKVDITREFASTVFSPGGNISVRNDAVPVIDCDVMDPDAAEEIRALAREIWPDAMERVGQAPKFALLLRRSEDDPAVNAKMTLFNARSDKAEIDIRADNGRQTVIAGRHPDTDGFYYYPDPSRTPRNTQVNDLPPLREIDAAKFLVETDAILARHGFLLGKKDNNKAADRKGAPEGGAASEGDRRAVLRALSGPNRLDDRQDWVRLGLALKSVFGDDHEFRAAWLDWSERWDGPLKDGEIERVWDSAKPDGSLGLGTVHHLLDQSGCDWRGAGSSGVLFPDPGVAGSVIEGVDRDEADEAQRLLAGGGRVLTRMQHVDPPTFVLDGWFPRKLLTTLYGEDGLGKSTLMLRVAVAVAVGRQVLDETPAYPLRVWFMSAEDTEAAIVDRLRRIVSDMRLTDDERALLDKNLLIPDLMTSDVTLIDADGKQARFARVLAAMLDRGAPDLLMLDPISDLFGANENDRAKVASFLRGITSLAYRHDAAVVLIGHPAKTADSTYSGSTAWSSKSRSRLWLEADGHMLRLSQFKSTMGQRKQDRVFAWSAAGVPFEMSEADRERQVAVLVEAAERVILDAIPTLSGRGMLLNTNVRSPDYPLKALDRENLLSPDMPRQAVETAFRTLLDKKILVASAVFDGKDGRPELRDGSRHARKGVWFGPKYEGQHAG